MSNFASLSLAGDGGNWAATSLIEGGGSSDTEMLEFGVQNLGLSAAQGHAYIFAYLDLGGTKVMFGTDIATFDSSDSVSMYAPVIDGGASVVLQTTGDVVLDLHDASDVSANLPEGLHLISLERDGANISVSTSR